MYIPHITSTGSCPTVATTISKDQAHDLPVHPLYHKYWTMSYRYNPPYHKKWTLSYNNIPYITSSDPCPTSISPISQVLDPVTPLIPLYHKYWTMSYQYIPSYDSRETFVRLSHDVPTNVALVSFSFVRQSRDIRESVSRHSYECRLVLFSRQIVA